MLIDYAAFAFIADKNTVINNLFELCIVAIKSEIVRFGTHRIILIGRNIYKNSL